VLNHIIKTVVVHLFPHILNQMLVSSDYPLIHNVSIILGTELHLNCGIKNEVFSSSFFPARNVLDQEAICVEPREENISDNALNTFSCELQRLSSHYW
jgi:hypothetical protein